MSTTLYRKYRPQVFGDLIDQDIVKQTLQNEIAFGQIAHAYLFSGPRGLGKTTTARLLSKAVNCQKRKDGDFEPCNTCSACQGIINNQSLDLIEIDAASNRGINEIRALKEHIGFTPSGSNYRVFIIDEVHMLTTEAFNALLKTLEEPPLHAIFILATTELHKVPDTIISRCQTFTFRRVDEQHLAERLAKIASAEGIKVDEKVLGQVAHLSGGFIRDAESMLGQLLSLGEKKITQKIASLVLPTSNLDFVVKFLVFLHAAKTSEALKHINELADQGVDLEYFSKELLEALRQLLIAQYGSVEYVDAHLRDLQDKFGVPQLLKLISLVNRALGEIKRADIPQLPLELVVVEFLEEVDRNNDETRNEDKDNKLELAPEPEKTKSSNQKNLKSEIQEVKPQQQKPVASEQAFVEQNTTSETSGDFAYRVNKTDTGLSEIKKKWPEVIKLSQEHNHSLPMTLKIAHLLTFNKIEPKMLEVGFEFELHVQWLAEPKIKVVLEDIIAKVYGPEVKFAARVLTQEEIGKFKQLKSEQETEQEKKLVDDVMQVFGGELAVE